MNNNKKIHICGKYYADITDKYNCVPYIRKNVTESLWDKLSKKNKEIYKIGDTIDISLEKYYPNLLSLLKGILKLKEKELGKNVTEIKEYIDKLEKMYDKSTQEIINNLEKKEK